jgi:hypothetical protein
MRRMRTVPRAGRSLPPLAISILTVHQHSRRSDRLFCPSFNRFVDSVIVIYGAGQAKRQRSARGFLDGRQASKTKFAGITREVIENNRKRCQVRVSTRTSNPQLPPWCWAGRAAVEWRPFPGWHQSSKTEFAGITREVIENNESDVRSVSMMTMRGSCPCWASRFRGQRQPDGRRMPLFSYDHQSSKTKLAGITREVVENNGKRCQIHVQQDEIGLPTVALQSQESGNKAEIRWFVEAPVRGLPITNRKSPIAYDQNDFGL